MLTGYMRVSKADGSQVLDLQRDALLAGGINTAHIYEDMASGGLDAAGFQNHRRRFSISGA
jgi:hypothetical protein